MEERFGVTELTLFGSFARDQATDDSDVDIIVKFNDPPSARTYFGAITYMEKLIGRTVDMSTVKELRTEILPFVEKRCHKCLTTSRMSPFLAKLHPGHDRFRRDSFGLYRWDG